jgi:tetratricopeptide (TPR) repeat protein
VLVAISWAAVRVRRTLPYVFVGWCWYVLMLAPVIGVQAGEQSRADRHLYLAMIGILFIVVWGMRDLLARVNAPSAAAAATSIAAVAALVPLGVAQVATWRDSMTLWQHAADVTSGNYKAYEKLGEAERDQGQYEAATADYRRALANAAPNSPRYLAVIHNDLGLVAARAGRPEEAVTEFQTALALNAQFSVANVNLANALATLGRLPEAANRFTAALAADPASVEARVGLGNVELQQGHATDAIASFREASRLSPEQADAHNGLGAALTEIGHPADAIPELTEALRLRPQFPNAEVNLAIAFAKTGHLDEARQHARAALALAPGMRAAQELLASIGG